MSFLSSLFNKGGPELFEGFSDSDKRRLLNIGEFELNQEKKRRAGAAAVKVIEVGVGEPQREELEERLSDADLDALLKIRKLTSQADATNGPAAISLYKKVLKLAPWDEVSMMSIGVEFANAAKFPTALQWLEKAHAANPDNTRVQNNLNGVRAAAR